MTQQKYLNRYYDSLSDIAFFFFLKTFDKPFSPDMFTLAWIPLAKSLSFFTCFQGLFTQTFILFVLWFLSPPVVHFLLDLIFPGSHIYCCSRVIDRHLIHSLTLTFCHYFAWLFSEINIVDASSVWAGHKVTAKPVTVHDALGFSVFYMERYIYLHVQKGSILLK